MKILSYNVNGIRAAMKKGLVAWLAEENPDIFCVQETKARPDQIDRTVITDLGYHDYWVSAVKKGYSGVAVFSKIKPRHVEYGCGIKKYDDEGRVLRLDFEDFSIMNVYMPSGTSGEERQAFKMQWLDDFQAYTTELKVKFPNLIICGDFNIAHKEIDIHNPVSNKNSSGFLPEERAWVSQFLASGFIDTFRHFIDAPHRYSWWTYRFGARGNNKGWRIDYFVVTENMRQRLVSANILEDVVHSDHCPTLLEISPIST
jgi:exodeoxyribonuclease-3